MTTFDDREKAAENRFAHDEALRFAARSKAARRLGLWVAEKLGKSSAEADDLAQDVIAKRVAGADDDAVATFLVDRAAAAGVSLDAGTIRQRMDALTMEALKEARAA